MASQGLLSVYRRYKGRLQSCWKQAGRQIVRVRLFLFSQQLPYSEIEPKIKPLVDLMNSSGVIETVASCQGHAIGRFDDPYVYFYAPVKVAAEIERVLRGEHGPRLERTFVQWELEGRFNGEVRLMFGLHCRHYSRQADTLLGAFLTFGLGRRQIDQDLAALHGLVAAALEKYSGVQNKRDSTNGEKQCHNDPY